MSVELLQVVLVVAAVAVVALVWWGIWEDTGCECRWCGQVCDQDGRPLDREPLVVKPGLCRACRELAQHDFPRR